MVKVKKMGGGTIMQKDGWVGVRWTKRWMDRFSVSELQNKLVSGRSVDNR